MKLDKDDRNVVALAVHRYEGDFNNEFNRFLQPIGLTYSPPAEVATYAKGIVELRVAINGLSADGGEIDDRFGPLIREAVIRERLREATHVEERRKHALDAELLANLDRELVPYADVMAKSWFQEVEPVRAPQPADYFPIEDIEKLIAEPRRYETPAPRPYDEKFHILQAPSLFLSDLDEARVASRIRGASLGVAYLDIDEFKKLNSEHGEPFVDRNVLPLFMRRLEAHVYMRGHAYRFGGDEYVILLNNTSPEEALDSMDRLRNSLAGQVYKGVSQKVTVSIGLVIVTGTCHLTVREVEDRAARAKNFAKKEGRNCIAAFEDPWFERLIVARS
jgi:diguanylate cyclase (GGDEF)-like protein